MILKLSDLVEEYSSNNYLITGLLEHLITQQKKLTQKEEKIKDVKESTLI